MTQTADVVIVGLGAMGAATAFHAAERGLSVVGIDRFRPPHPNGSTHAETRFTRLAVAEGPEYLPLVRRSHELWHEFEQRSGRTLFYECGGLIVTSPGSAAGDRWGDFVTRTADIAGDAGIGFDLLDLDGVQARHPQLQGLTGHSFGFEPTAGLVACEDALTVQLELAAGAGAELRFDERVVAVEPDDGGVDVVTDRGRCRAERVVLAAGPWMTDLAPPIDAERLSVTRQVVYWFEPEDRSAFAIDAIPFVMWIGDTIDDYLAVFPMPPGRAAVKVLTEQFAVTTDADTVDRTVSDDEIARFYERSVAPRVVGLSDRCVGAEVCLYTNTPDDRFLIDTAPESERVLVMSPCSGHGYKHSPAIGEAIAQQLVTGTSTIDLTPFGRTRTEI